MKINGTGAIGYVPPSTDGGRQAPGQSSATPDGDRVTLSAGAEFMQTIRDEARPPGVREDVVADVRAQIADGSFESGVNMDQLLDSLMSDL